MIGGLQQAGLSPSEIAQRANISRTTVWRGAVGSIRHPSLDVAMKLDTLHTRVVGRSLLTGDRRR